MARALMDRYHDCVEGRHGRRCWARPTNILAAIFCCCDCHKRWWSLPRIRLRWR